MRREVGVERGSGSLFRVLTCFLTVGLVSQGESLPPPILYIISLFQFAVALSGLTFLRCARLIRW